MKRFVKLKLLRGLIAFLVAFLAISNVQAATGQCSYEEKANLNDAAQKIRVSYEVVEKKTIRQVEIEEESGLIDVEVITPEFAISIYNMMESIYITQTDDTKNSASKDIHYNEAKNGVYTFTSTDQDNIITYTFKVKSALKDCMGETLRTVTIKKPRKNGLANYGVCDGLQDVIYCKPYVTEELNISSSELAGVLAEYLNTSSEESKDNKSEDKSLLTTLKDNYIYVLLGVVLVAGATGGTIYIVKKRSAL